MNMEALIQKLKQTAEFGEFEEEGMPAEPQFGCGVNPQPKPEFVRVDVNYPPISYATITGGRKVPLLKTLLTSCCENNCFYCGCRAGRDCRRTTFTPDDMAKIFMEMYQKKYVQGLFLSSGVFRGAVATQDQLIKTAEILRNKYQYRDYIHLKIMPGAEYDQVLQAMKLSDRVSVNLEGATPQRLKHLAPMKAFNEQLLRPLQWVEKIRQTYSPGVTWNGRWPSTVTQFVVGGTDENDVELLTISEYLIRHLKLSRTYYSAFSPVMNTPLEERAPENMWRRYRLFQASFLLRDYPFTMEDFPFEKNGNLPLDRDPKFAWAEMNLKEAPIEINKADYTSLLHIPGIGPKGAATIINIRRRDSIHHLGDLKRLGIITKRAAPFLLINGKRPEFQYSLFSNG